MAAYTAGQVTISNGSKAVVINSDENPESVAKGDFLFLSGSDPKEINRTYINDQQKHVIELIENWDSGNKTNQPAIVLPTTVEFRDTVAAIKNANLLINDNMQAMSDWQSKLGTVTFIGLDGTERTVPTLASFLATLGTAATKDVTTSNTDTTAGRLLKVGDFGWGNNAILTENFDEISGSGLYRNSQGTAVGIPLEGATWSLIHNNIGESYATQVAVEIFKSSPEQGMAFRTKEAGIWTPWKMLYHSRNTNFNEFGGASADDFVGYGYFRTSGIARFFLPINSAIPPSGISVTGTFSIRVGNSATLASGVSPIFQGVSSNKICIVDVSGLSGTTGDVAILATESETSKVTVNF